MARRVVQPGGRAKCAAPFIEGSPAPVIPFPEVTPGQVRADQCGLTEGSERVSDGTGSRAKVCRAACVEQCDLRRRLPARHSNLRTVLAASARSKRRIYTGLALHHLVDRRLPPCARELNASLQRRGIEMPA